MAQAQKRERLRGMGQYLQALVYVDGLRQRGVWLKPAAQAGGEEGRGTADSGKTASAEEGKGKGNSVGNNKDMVFTHMNGTEYAIHKDNTKKFNELVEQFVKRREVRIILFCHACPIALFAFIHVIWDGPLLVEVNKVNFGIYQCHIGWSSSG